MSDMENRMREEARLVILKALAKEKNETLPSSILETELAIYGIRRTRAWLHMEMEYLAELGGITLVEANTIKVATLTELGHRHLNRDAIIEGVKRPSRAGA